MQEEWFAAFESICVELQPMINIYKLGLSIIILNYIDTGVKVAAGTRSPLWRTRLLVAG